MSTGGGAIVGIESVRLPKPLGKYICSNIKCKRDFNTPKLTQTTKTVEKRCPHCNQVLKSYLKSELEKLAKKRRNP